MTRQVFNRLIFWDARICVSIHRLNGRRSFDLVNYTMSRLGDGYIYAFLSLLILLFDFDVARFIIPAGIIGFTIEHTIYLILKKKIRRSRPFTLNEEINHLIRPPDEYSFPSGHTAGAFLVATLLGYFYPATLLPSLFFASMIGFSRIYNGVHYPGDVLAGTTLGIVCAKIGLVITL